MDEDEMRRLVELFRDGATAMKILRADQQIILRNLTQEKDKEFWYRMYVRSLFASTEARCYQMRQLVLSAHRIGACSLTPEESLYLAELTPVMRDQGVVATNRAKIGTAANFLFTFKMLSKLLGQDVSVPTDTAEWGRYKRALEIRDRLTHPKTSEHVQISRGDFQLLDGVGKWVDDLFAPLGHLLRTVFRPQRDEGEGWSYLNSGRNKSELDAPGDES